MQQSTLQFLLDQLSAQGVAVYPTRPESMPSAQLRKRKDASWIEEVYIRLGGKNDCWNLSFALPEGMETEEVRLSLDGPLQFNRYREETLQSELYSRQDPAWLSGYRRLCRSAERECLKAGSRQGIWTNREAEKHFGPAQEAGDFFGAGSSGWKLEAFRNFLADFYLLQGRQKFKRLALYDRLMIQGQLIPLQQLLLSRSEPNLSYLLKFLRRQLGVPREGMPQAKAGE